ncbi:MAG: TLD domain-containing protein, partial [Terracidiphilus sp.]|nr:TLD domain-containing protein [Terracidiphilus sp.]
GARLAGESVGEVGVVEVVYRVPAGRVESVTLSLSVCGLPLPASPWTVLKSLLGGSAILASVAPAGVAAFLRELSAWLPHRAYTLLYRGSRDGMTAAAFHGLCDGKGPTLVLVQCEEGWVFGGHAGASWEPPPGFKVIPSGDAFLFSVTGPYTTAPVHFPVKASDMSHALYGSATCGPVFYGGLCVYASETRLPDDSFDGGCFCGIGTVE